MVGFFQYRSGYLAHATRPVPVGGAPRPDGDLRRRGLGCGPMGPQGPPLARPGKLRDRGSRARSATAMKVGRRLAPAARLSTTVSPMEARSAQAHESDVGKPIPSTMRTISPSTASRRTFLTTPASRGHTAEGWIRVTTSCASVAPMKTSTLSSASTSCCGPRPTRRIYRATLLSAE